MSYEKILKQAPFATPKAEKEKALTERLLELTELHIKNCREYANMTRGIGFDPKSARDYYDLPFLPVALFKTLELKSVPSEEVFKITTSSGTTGQAVSKIYLDRTTAANQQKTLVKIVADFLKSSRFPMLIIDNPSVIKNRAMFSARGAGILGFSIFGADITYALDDNMRLDLPTVESFLKKHKERKILIFGFTFMVWEHFYGELLKLDQKPDFSNAVLIHGGGWKKLVSEAVSKEEFKQKLKNVCGLNDIHDYYGMVEQTGCVYMECECGFLHASSYSDVITRRHTDFSLCDFGEKGIIQVVSALPESYPGHSLLTEDEGVIIGEDDCPCGRKGKYFKALGRLKNAEIRGCSDAYAINSSNR
jgi:phenylacetate-coenzyme A ligase PaaK-like adenylate-forming protein